MSDEFEDLFKDMAFEKLWYSSGIWFEELAETTKMPCRAVP
jgi:hypothetical protein